MEVGDAIVLKESGKWSFSGRVADTFDSHVSRSVPLYEDGHELICFLSDFFLGNGSLCYDIGSSTGTLLEKLGTRHRNLGGLRLIGIEPVPEMVMKAKSKTRDPRLSLCRFSSQIREVSWLLRNQVSRSWRTGTAGVLCINPWRPSLHERK